MEVKFNNNNNKKLNNIVFRHYPYHMNTENDPKDSFVAVK